jgi:hypothetical protein
MNNSQLHAKRELDILAETVPDAIVTPFAKEIIALCKVFGESGQSGMSAPYTAGAISQAVKNLMMFLPIAPITGNDSEWVNITEMNGGNLMYQNSRCSALFKYTDHRASYVDAIVWQGEEKWDTFTGSVYIDNVNFELIRSSQYVKFPFKPKTFYIDVVRVPITKKDAESRNLHYIEDGFNECYYTILKDPTQLEEVFEYYDKLTIKK